MKTISGKILNQSDYTISFGFIRTLKGEQYLICIELTPNRGQQTIIERIDSKPAWFDALEDIYIADNHDVDSLRATLAKSIRRKRHDI